MTYEVRTLEGSFIEPGETDFATYRGKFNFCLSNPDTESPHEFPSGVNVVLVAKFANSSKEWLMRGVEGVSFSQPGVYVVDCPEPVVDFKIVALAVPSGTTVDYRLSR